MESFGPEFGWKGWLPRLHVARIEGASHANLMRYPHSIQVGAEIEAFAKRLEEQRG